MEFKVNDLITLKLEGGKTNIYVGGKLFRQCKFLALIGNIEDTIYSEEISSIDEAIKNLDRSLEEGDLISTRISPEMEFWGHCSNMQGWVEQKYDSHFLHAGLAFPLLRRLRELGDLQARKIFAEEIVKRYMEGNDTVQTFLIKEGFLNELKLEEKELILGTQALGINEIEKNLLSNIKFVSDIKLMKVGIELNNGKITGLGLDGSNRISLPPQIGSITSIETLLLSGFTDKELPEWIGNLCNLKYVDIHNNLFERLPETIGKLKNLLRIDLRYNQLRSLPNSIKDLKKLKVILLGNNEFENFPIVVSELDNLEILGLEVNRIRKIPKEVLNARKLKLLGLANNQLEEICIELFSMPNLKTFQVQNNFHLSLTDEMKKKAKEKKIEIIGP